MRFEPWHPLTTIKKICLWPIMSWRNLTSLKLQDVIKFFDPCMHVKLDLAKRFLGLLGREREEVC